VLDATLGRRTQAGPSPLVTSTSAHPTPTPSDSQPAPPQDTQPRRRSSTAGREARHTYAGLPSQEHRPSSSRLPEIHVEPATDSESEPSAAPGFRPRELLRKSASQSLRNRLESLPLMAHQASPLSSSESFLLDVPSPWSSQGSLRNKRSSVSASSSVEDFAGLDAFLDPAIRQMSMAAMMSRESLPGSDGDLSPQPSFEDLRPMSPWQSFDEPEQDPQLADSPPVLDQAAHLALVADPTSARELTSPVSDLAAAMPKGKARKRDEPVAAEEEPDPFDALFDDLAPAKEESEEPSVAAELASLRGDRLVPKDSTTSSEVLAQNRDKLFSDLKKLGDSTAEADRPLISLINPEDKIKALAVPAARLVSNKGTGPASFPSSFVRTAQRNPWTLNGSPAQQALFDQVVALTAGRNLSDTRPLDPVDALLPQVRELFTHCVKVKDFSSAAILAGLHLLPRMGGLAPLNDAGRALEQEIDRFRDGLGKEAKVILGLGEAAFLGAQGQLQEAIAKCRKEFDGAGVLKTVADPKTRVGSRISFVSSIEHRTLAHALETRLALGFGLTGPQRLRYRTQLDELKASYPDAAPPALPPLQTPTVRAEASGSRPGAPLDMAGPQPAGSMDAEQHALYAHLKNLSEGRQLGVGAPADIPELDRFQDQAAGLFDHLVQAGDGDRAAKLAGRLLLPRMGAQNRIHDAQALIKDIAPFRPKFGPEAQVILALGEASFLMSQARPGNGWGDAAPRAVRERLDAGRAPRRGGPCPRVEAAAVDGPPAERHRQGARGTPAGQDPVHAGTGGRGPGPGGQRREGRAGPRPAAGVSALHRDRGRHRGDRRPGPVRAGIGEQHRQGRDPLPHAPATPARDRAAATAVGPVRRPSDLEGGVRAGTDEHRGPAGPAEGTHVGHGLPRLRHALHQRGRRSGPLGRHRRDAVKAGSPNRAAGGRPGPARPHLTR
jgi:hypothetical protein